MIFVVLIALIIRFIVSLLAFLLSSKNYLDTTKIRPFECGFSVGDHARLPLSMRFFLIALIFLVFDVELILLFPYLVYFSSRLSIIPFILVLLFILILSLGLYYEWRASILEWTKFNRIFKKNLTVNKEMALSPVKF